MKAKKVTHNGQSKWKVERTLNGKRERKFFPSEAKAKDWITKQENKVKKVGIEMAAKVDDKFIREAFALADKLDPYGLTLADAVAMTIDRIEKDGAADPLGKIRDAYIADKKAGGLRELTIKELERRTMVFVQAFGPNTKASSVTVPRANNWINGLEHGLQTRNHYRRVAYGMMEYARKFHGLASNPFAQVTKKKVTRERPCVFTKGQMKTMLDASKGDAELTAWVALGAYAGLRASEIERLDWSDIHLKTDLITVRPEASKSGKPRNVIIRRKLKKILQRIEQIGGPVVRSDMNTSKKLKHFREDMKFKWPHNGLRHSFGTFHYAAFRHAGETAIQMGHRGSPTMLLEHYDRGDVSKEDALEWWDEAPPKKKAAKKKTARKQA